MKISNHLWYKIRSARGKSYIFIKISGYQQYKKVFFFFFLGGGGQGDLLCDSWPMSIPSISARRAREATQNAKNKVKYRIFVKYCTEKIVLKIKFIFGFARELTRPGLLNFRMDSHPLFIGILLTLKLSLFSTLKIKRLFF